MQELAKRIVREIEKNNRATIDIDGKKYRGYPCCDVDIGDVLWAWTPEPKGVEPQVERKFVQVKVLAGSWWGTHGLSNHWTLEEVETGTKWSSYGDFYKHTYEVVHDFSKRGF